MSQTFAGEIDAMGVVNEAVKDRVGISRIANERMPFIDGDLAWPLEVYTSVAAMYFIMLYPMTLFAKRLEVRVDR